MVFAVEKVLFVANFSRWHFDRPDAAVDAIDSLVLGFPASVFAPSTFYLVYGFADAFWALVFALRALTPAKARPTISDVAVTKATKKA